MNTYDVELSKLAELFVTDKDAYDGLSAESPPILPDNILIFTRTKIPYQHIKLIDYRHHRHVLIFFLKTGGSLFVDQHHYVAQENQTLLIFPFQQHHFATPPDNLLWLFVSFDLPKEQNVGSFHQLSPLSETVKSALSTLLQIYHTRQAQEAAVLLSYILYELGAGGSTSPSDLTPDQKIIKKINSYIHAHLSTPFTLQNVGEHCALSISSICLKFKKNTGISLGHYIHSVRLNHSMKLLIQTDLTVSEIAYQSGFSSPAIFCRAFKQATGKSALKFKQSKT